MWKGLIAAFSVVISLGCVSIDVAFPSSSVPPEQSPMVTFGEIEYRVEIADDDYERTRGLANRPYLRAGEGMLFVPDSGPAGQFWMKGMRFPLDFVWIADCKVVDLDSYVPIPAPLVPDEHIRRYESGPRADYTLEINVGDTERYDIKVGDKLRFKNMDYLSCEKP